MRFASRTARMAFAGLSAVATTAATTAAITVASTVAWAADQVFVGRLAENPNNMVACRGIDEQIEREHTVRISGDRVEYIAPGGERLRFQAKGPGLWGTVEELGPERLKYTFSPETGAFTIRENNIGCIWSGTLRPRAG